MSQPVRNPCPGSVFQPGSECPTTPWPKPCPQFACAYYAKRQLALKKAGCKRHFPADDGPHVSDDAEAVS